MNFFKKKHVHGIDCNCNERRRFNLIFKNYDDFYLIPCIRLTLTNFKGTFYKGRNLNNGFKKLKFSINFLNYKIEKQKKLKTK
jgi:hypothetical protein